SAARFAALALRVSAAFFAAADRAGSTVFFAEDFFAAVVFFAAAFLAGAFFFAGPFARLIAISSTARSKVMSSTLSPRGIVAFVSPSVTYGPKRPSRTLIGLPLTGSASNSLSALDAR